MASVMIQGDDGKIAVHVWYSIMSGEVWHFSVGKIVFVDQESGILRPGWKRALARQALRRPGPVGAVARRRVHDRAVTVSPCP